MKIAIIGIGTVGGAVYNSLLIKCLNDDEIVAYDKFKNIGTLDNVLDSDIVFLCLPTLYNHEMSSYDKTAIHEICSALANANYHGLVIVKSTVEPTTCQLLADQYHLSVIHNPEFLTARTAFQDVHEQKHIVIGSTDRISSEQLNTFVKFYQAYYPSAEITMCKSTESESVKIFCNNFYSVKVQFFNELYLLCQKLNIDYAVVKNTMLKNGWINPMHTDVPGPDGQLSYGGMCFPKDTNALLSFMKKIETPHQVLAATVSERNEFRQD